VIWLCVCVESEERGRGVEKGVLCFAMLMEVGVGGLWIIYIIC
jgi:hypothetical protein